MPSSRPAIDGEYSLSHQHFTRSRDSSTHVVRGIYAGASVQQIFSNLHVAMFGSCHQGRCAALHQPANRVTLLQSRSDQAAIGYLGARVHICTALQQTLDYQGMAVSCRHYQRSPAILQRHQRVRIMLAPDQHRLSTKPCLPCGGLPRSRPTATSTPPPHDVQRSRPPSAPSRPPYQQPNEFQHEPMTQIAILQHGTHVILSFHIQA